MMITKVESINDERKKDTNLLSHSEIEHTLETETFALRDIQRNLSLQLQAEKDIPKDE